MDWITWIIIINLIFLIICRGGEMAYLFTDPGFILPTGFTFIVGSLGARLGKNALMLIFTVWIIYYNDERLVRFPKRYPITSIHGKKYLVTGANSGTGLGTTQALLEHGAHVYMACRSIQRCQLALDSIPNNKNATVVQTPLDLSTLDSVSRFYQSVKSIHFDGIINNAGFSPKSGMKKTQDNIESSLGTMHLGHYLLTKMILRTNTAGSKTRVVNVASGMHTLCLWFDCFGNVKGAFEGETDILSYGRAKFGNVLHAYGLAQHDEAIAYSINLGFVATNITAFSRITSAWQRDAVSGSYPMLYALMVDAPKSLNGGVMDTTFGISSPKDNNKILSGALSLLVLILKSIDHSLPLRSERFSQAILDRESDELWKVSEELLSHRGFT